MNIPDGVLNAAAQGMWDSDQVGPDSPWEDLAPSFRASLVTQVEAACQPIAEWARKEALKEAAEAVLPRSERDRYASGTHGDSRAEYVLRRAADTIRAIEATD